MPFTLLHPGLFAFGIACVSIPIILHLLKRKRRPIPWAAMRFLEQAYRKRRRRMTIEQLIMLALRCALIMLIAAGIGALMLGKPNAQHGPSVLTIVIDNSIGSALSIDGQTSLDAHKQAAIELLNTLDTAKGDRASLIVGAKPARALVLPASSDIGEIKRLISGIEPTDSMFDLTGSINLAAQAAATTDAQRSNAQPNHRLLIATDARGDLHETESNTLTSGFDQILASRIPSQAVNNVGIQTSSAMRSLVTRTGIILPMSIRVELLRSGELIGDNQSSTITITDSQSNTLGTRMVHWAEGQSQLDAVVPIDPQQLRTNNAQTALLNVQIDDDANERDNQRLVGIPTIETIRVGVLDRSQDQGTPGRKAFSPALWMKSALAPTETMGIEIEILDASRASSLLSPRLDAAIVLAPAAISESGWRRLAELHASGMMVLIAQDAQSESTNWVEHANSLLPIGDRLTGLIDDPDNPTPLSSSIAADNDSILAGLQSEYTDLAKPVTVSRRMRLLDTTGTDSSQTRTLLSLSTGEPIIQHTLPQDDQGTLVIFAIAIDLEWTNLPARGLFVPLMQELIREGVGKSATTPWAIAGTQNRTPPWVASTQRLNSLSTADSPDARTNIAGVLTLIDQQGATRGVSIIHPDTDSAKTNPTDEQTFSSLIAKMTGHTSNDSFKITWLDNNSSSSDQASNADASINPTNNDNSLALWMLLGACVIALIETTLSKLFSVKLGRSVIEEARA